MKLHITSIFNRLFKTDETLSISRSNPAYGFFINECPSDISKDSSGNLIIRNEREKLVNLKKSLIRIITVGSDSYSYFVNEYRQNAPVRDANGNIVLNDEIFEGRTK